MRKKNGYIVPEGALNVAFGNNGGYGSMPCKDDTYPIPEQWIKANARRFYFTDEQILNAAVTEFNTPNLPKYSRCYLVYFLISDGEIIYVGQSSDFDNRLIAHKKNGVPFDSFAWVEVPQLYMKSIEAYYIDRIQPILNNDYPSVYGFGDVAKSFEDPKLRDIRKEFVIIVKPIY